MIPESKYKLATWVVNSLDGFGTSPDPTDFTCNIFQQVPKANKVYIQLIEILFDGPFVNGVSEKPSEDFLMVHANLGQQSLLTTSSHGTSYVGHWAGNMNNAKTTTTNPIIEIRNLSQSNIRFHLVKPNQAAYTDQGCVSVTYIFQLYLVE